MVSVCLLRNENRDHRARDHRECGGRTFPLSSYPISLARSTSRAGGRPNLGARTGRLGRASKELEPMDSPRLLLLLGGVACVRACERGGPPRISAERRPPVAHSRPFLFLGRGETKSEPASSLRPSKTKVSLSLSLSVSTLRSLLWGSSLPLDATTTNQRLPLLPLPILSLSLSINESANGRGRSHLNLHHLGHTPGPSGGNQLVL